jgi:tRNA(fMet)-specific endonuclease VapC
VALILDTNAISAVADHDPAVVAILAHADEMSLPVLAIGEYRYGISQSRHKARYESWLEGLILDCRVLDVDEGTTRQYAGIRLELRTAGKPIPTNDLWIAALCRQHGLPLLSRDRHFDSVPGIQRVNW